MHARTPATLAAALMSLQWLSSCSSVEPPELPPQPAPLHGVAQVREEGRLRFALCALSECPRPTPKTLPGGPVAAEDRQQAVARVVPAALPPRAPVALPDLREPNRTHVAVIGFEAGGITLSARARAGLDALRPVLQSAQGVSITGYTDAVGSMRGNTKLANDRAQAVHRALRIPPPLIGPMPAPQVALPAAAGAGAPQGRPMCCYVAGNDTEAQRARNRRAEVVFTVPSTPTIERHLARASALLPITPAAPELQATGRTAPQ